MKWTRLIFQYQTLEWFTAITGHLRRWLLPPIYHPYCRSSLSPPLLTNHGTLSPSSVPPSKNCLLRLYEKGTLFPFSFSFPIVMTLWIGRAERDDGPEEEGSYNLEIVKTYVLGSPFGNKPGIGGVGCKVWAYVITNYLWADLRHFRSIFRWVDWVLGLILSTFYVNHLGLFLKRYFEIYHLRIW